MSELPNSWTVGKLKNCAAVLDKLRVPVNSDERKKRLGNVPYYGATGQVGWIDDYLFDEELLLIGEDGAPFLDKSKPISYIVHGKSWVNNHAHVLRAFSEVTSNKYLKYFLDQFDFREYVNGTTRLKLTQGSLNEIPVKLAPLNEQRRIVAKLEKLLSRMEAAQARMAKISLILKRFRESVLAAACSGRLTTDWKNEHINTSSWKQQVLGDLISSKPKNGYSAKPVKYETSYKVLTLTATTSGRFKPEHFKYFDEHIPKDSPFWLEPGDILVQRGNTIEYVGVSAIYDGDPGQFIYPDLMMKFRPKSNVSGQFLYLALSSENARNYLRSHATGTAGSMPKINQQVLVNTPINIPSLDEQQEIVRRVESLFETADVVEARYLKAKVHIDKITQSILARAFRGELVPQDPNDEPGSALI